MIHLAPRSNLHTLYRARHALGWMFAAVVLLGAADAAAVRFAAGTETWIVDSQTDPRLEADERPVTVASVGSASAAGVQTSAQGHASSQVGGIHLTASSASQLTQGPTDAGSPRYSMGVARGGFSDAFVLSGANLVLGGTGILTVAFRVSGSLGGSGQGAGGLDDGLGRGAAANWEASFSLDGQSDGVRWEGYQSLSVEPQGSVWGGDAAPGTFVFDLPVVFGETLYLSISGEVEARTGVGALFPGPAFVEALAAASLGNTIAWGGILALTDANGAPLSDFSAISPDTGFDYRNAYVAVPEPGTSALVLTSLVALARARQRRPRA